MAANIVGIGELLGQGGPAVHPVGVAANAAAGDGETIFAQLLEGLGLAAPAAPLATTEMAAPAKSPSDAQSDATALAQVSAATPAEMLALCGASMAPQESMWVPPLIAVRPSAEASGVASTSLDYHHTRAAVTPQLPSVAALQAGSALPGATAPAPAKTTMLTEADMQWLHSKSVATPNQVAQPQPSSVATQAPTLPTQSAPAQAQQAPPQPMSEQLGQASQPTQIQPQANPLQQTQAQLASNAALDQTRPAADHELPAALAAERDIAVDRQAVLQTAVTQSTPMVAMVTAQSATPVKEEQPEAPAVDTADISGAISAAQWQTPGTQLSDDANAMAVAPRHHLQAQVGTHQWATELGNKLTLLATKDTQSATLYMTPADLGPVQVRIDLNQDQASVWFTAEHADTRSALEQSLPRLREMFAAQGMSLTDAGVFGDRSRQQQPQSEASANRLVGSQYASDEALADTAMVRNISLGLLDAYA